MSILTVENVTKSFADVKAVNDLSFAVEPGEIYGFLGGNGAGKTTTLRMVLDIIRPTSGSISVLGGSPDRDNAAGIGFLPEERGLYKNMTAIDTIVYFGRLKGMEAGAARKAGLDLLERFGLGDRAKSNIADMSKGMAQKVQLAASIVNDPELLLLDEPFSGLDPVNQGLLEDEILRASKGGAAVVFSTHVMQHAERLCDRLLLLKRGEKRFEGTLEQARDMLPSQIEAIAKPGIETVPGLAQATRGRDVGEGWFEYSLTVPPEGNAGAVLEHCTATGVPLRRFSEHRASLHEVFVELVGDEGVKK